MFAHNKSLTCKRLCHIINW